MNEQIETQLPATRLAAAEARGFLRATLQTWQLDGWGDLTELLASELVSNVVAHVGTPMTLRIGTDKGVIRVEVSDRGDTDPEMLRVDTETEHGRGLFIVNELATRWGSDRDADGKTVWFELDVATATEEVHGRD